MSVEFLFVSSRAFETSTGRARNIKISETEKQRCLRIISIKLFFRYLYNNQSYVESVSRTNWLTN